MMLRLKIGILIASVALCGCNTVRGASEDVSSAAYRPVGHLIIRDTGFVSEGGGYAIVLLRQGDVGRNQRACSKMVEAMDMRVGPADSRPIVVDDVLLYDRPVYWPVTIRTELNCENMLQNYDHARAMANLQRIPNWSNLGQGPFVVVRKQNGTQAGLFDFSNVAGEDFDEQFAAIVRYMSQRADVWSPDFYHPATFRQTMRYYVLERSGEGPKVLATLIDLNDG